MLERKYSDMKLLTTILLLLFILTACAPEPTTIEELSKNADSMSSVEKEVAMQQAMEIEKTEELSQEQQNFENTMVEAMQEAALIKQGPFTSRAHAVSGNARIIEKDGQALLILDEGFSTDSGPRLHIFITSHQNPTGTKDVHEGNYLDLGQLKGKSGQQTYTLPAGTNPNDYNTVVVYCKPFKVVFSIAMLQ